MNAPFIFEEGCQFTNNTLTDLDGICWDSWKSVNPFSLDAMIGPLEQDKRPTVSESMDSITESPSNDASPTSLGRMVGLSRSMPNMSVGSGNTGAPAKSPKILEAIHESVLPLHLETSNQYSSPEDCLSILQILCDQKDGQQNTLQGLPVQLNQEPRISSAASHISPQTSLISPAMSQNSPQTSQISPATSQISLATSQNSKQTLQMSPVTSLSLPQTSQIISTAASSSGLMASLPHIRMNFDPEKDPDPDWRQLEASQPYLKQQFGYGNNGSNLRLLKRKLSSDFNSPNAKLFAHSSGNGMPVKKEFDSKSTIFPQ
ncbi:uncharacterized protein LOC117110212, partial [Anneissia japonica]|uniref:uncharacterized protein LOC117110212 n=1 Tax=Anneissia japonica TaxID=1529436 RepID=UPI0014254FD2